MRPHPIGTRLVAAFTLALLAAGCRRERSHAEFSDRDTAAVEQLAPGDMMMTTRDSAMEMGVIGDHITMRLSRKSLAKVRAETDTGTVQGDGFGASIERLVKKGVATALSQQVVVPLSDVRDARYENGRIVFDWVSKPKIGPESTKSDGKDLLASFSDDDSRRFVAAVKAHKAGQAR